MADSGGTSEARSAMEWLAGAALDPEACRREWERSPAGVVLLPAGRRWDVLILPADLGGPTLDVLAMLVDRPGPVLADPDDARTGFFVPPGTAARWLGTGVRGAGRGTWIVVPHPGRRATGGRWLVPPDGSGTLTDPAVLELAMHEAAARLAETETGAPGPRRGTPGARTSPGTRTSPVRGPWRSWAEAGGQERVRDKAGGAESGGAEPGGLESAGEESGSDGPGRAEPGSGGWTNEES